MLPVYMIECLQLPICIMIHKNIQLKKLLSALFRILYLFSQIYQTQKTESSVLARYICFVLSILLYRYMIIWDRDTISWWILHAKINQEKE